MANDDTKIITGIKLKYLSEKVNEYGTNHFFAVLDITPLQDLIELRKSMRMPIWDYNKFYLEINDVRLNLALNKIFLILWIKPFENTILRRMVSNLQVIQFLKLITINKLCP